MKNQRLLSVQTPTRPGVFRHFHRPRRLIGTTYTIAFALFLAMVPSALMAQSAPSKRQAERSITPVDLHRHIEILAHDSMRGRATPSPELDLAAEYVAAEFRRIGLLPGAEEGAFVQRFPLGEIRSELTVEYRGFGSWEAGVDLFQNEGGETNGPVSGPLVVVTGLGSLPQPERIKGAIVLLAAEWGMGVAAPSQELLDSIQAATPAVVIVALEVPDRLWKSVSALQNRPLVMTEGSVQERFEKPPTLWVQMATARALLGQHSVELRTDGPTTLHTLDDLWCTVNATVVITPKSAPNVVGILEGRDPTLKDEYLVLSAHLDHLGVGRPVDGDSIRNGADDNASGIAGMVEIAEAMGMLDLKPRRSIIFLAVSGEEEGLWGSEHFAGHPPVPISDIVADVNMDMIGRNWADTIAAIGKERSNLGETVDRVNGLHPDLGMAVVGDIWPEEGYYARSDQSSFSDQGVPALWFFSGPHEDYHGVGDETEKVNTEKASRIARLLFHLSIEIANNPERPKWKPAGE